MGSSYGARDADFYDFVGVVEGYVRGKRGLASGNRCQFRRHNGARHSERLKDNAGMISFIL
jgi:hypothetical protein